MATTKSDNLSFETPPAKRARLESSIDNKAIESDAAFSSSIHILGNHIIDAPDFKMTNPELKEGPQAKASLIPGLGLLSQPPQIGQPSALNEPTAKALENSDILYQEVSQTIPPSDSNDEGSPMMTAALEALLGKPAPPSSAMDLSTEVSEKKPVSINHTVLLKEESDVVMAETQLDESPMSSTPTISNAEEAIRPGHMLGAATGSIDAQQVEFEVDSSPYETSSDDSSDESSSSNDDDEDEAYKLLSPEEQARILMEGDGGSDDEGGGPKGTKGPGAQLRTKNEVSEEVVPKPDVTITPEMKIEVLGLVEHVVENVVLIKGKTSGEHRVLETGSVLCLEDRSVLGVVADTLGRVQQPLYSVRFTNAEEVKKAGLSVGTQVLYSEQHSTYVFTQALKAFKGSDASNLHDEEVGDEEVEFSDDEAELEHKRRLKQKKLERRGVGDRSGRQQNGNASGRGAHPLQQQQTPYDPAVGLSYDDEDDGPYRPLTRPAGFAQTVGRTEAPQEGVYSGRPQSHPREPYGRGRGLGDRGDRGRGRGDRGRGYDRGQRREGFQDRRGSRDDGFIARPYDNRSEGGYSQPPQVSPMSQGSLVAQNFPNFNYNQTQHYNPQQYNPQQPFSPQFPPVPYLPPQPQQQPYTQIPQSWAHPTPAMPTGAYINPAFFGNQPHPRGPQHWSPPPQHPQTADSIKAFNDAQERLNILKNLGRGRGAAS